MHLLVKRILNVTKMYGTTLKKEIFLCEPNNGRKVEVNNSNVSQRNTFIATAAGAAVYIIPYTDSVQPCIPLDVT